MWSKSYEIKIRANQTFTIKKEFIPWLTMDEGDMVHPELERLMWFALCSS